MLYAAIDIHKRTFQAAVLDVETGETVERRFGATREELSDWAMPLQGKLAAVAIEATNGWRWVWRELSARGFDLRLVDPAQTKALRGRIKRAKTDRLDARWLCVLLAKEMLPESWLPPAEIRALRDQTRLRKALAEDRTRWAQRLHALFEPDRVSRGPLSQDAVLGRGDPPLSCRDRGSIPRSCSSVACVWRSRAAVRSRMSRPIWA